MIHQQIARIGLIVLLLMAVLPVMAQGGDELTEEYVSTAGGVTFNYPEEWFVTETLPGFIVLATEESAVDLLMGEPDESLPEDAVALGIFSPSILGMLIDGFDPASLDEAWETLLTQEEDMEMTFGEPEEITIGDHAAVQATLTADGQKGTATFIDFDGAYLLVLATAPDDAYADHAEMVDAIIETISYGAVSADTILTFTTLDETLTLEYPGGWLAFDLLGTIAVSNDTELMNRGSEDPVESGTVRIFIFRPGVFSIETDRLTDAVTQFGESVLYGEELTEPVETTLGDFDAARLDHQNDIGEGYLLAVDLDGDTMFIQVLAAVDELADFEEEVLAILESIEYSAE
jgi:hypothetical protein